MKAKLIFAAALLFCGSAFAQSRLVVLVDGAKGSPMQQPNFVKAALPAIDDAVRKMPLGSEIILTSFGDPERLPMTWRIRIQARTTKDGASLEKARRDVRSAFVGMSARINADADDKRGVIAGLERAVGYFDKSQPGNTLIVLSNLAERSGSVDCTEVRSCVLPVRPTFSLKDVHAEIYFYNLSSDRRLAQILFQQWKTFLGGAGIDLQLKSTM